MPNATEVIHHPYAAPEGFASPQPPSHRASSVFFADVAAMRARDWRSKAGYTYGLHGTPSTFLLESRIAALEHGAHCTLVPSGLAAVAVVDIAFLASGDEVLIPSNSYGPNLTLAQAELAKWGIAHQTYDPMNPADLAAKISQATKLVWLEAPGSVTMEFPPLSQLLAIVREASLRRSAEREIITALDNTWGAGIAFNGFDFGTGDGADVVAQALTKYPSGGGDVLMGSVVTQREDLAHAVLGAHMRTGYGVSGPDVADVLKGLATIHLRYGAQDASARQLAAWCAGRKEFAQVRHPALVGAPGHEHWRALCTSLADPEGKAASIFSVVFQSAYSQAQVDAFCERLSLFKLAYSWAGPMSLVVPYDMRQIRSQWGQGCLVRFSVGLEEADLLQKDLQDSLLKL